MATLDATTANTLLLKRSMPKLQNSVHNSMSWRLLPSFCKNNEAGKHLNVTPMGPGLEMGYNMVPIKHLMTSGSISKQKCLNRVGQSLSYTVALAGRSAHTI